MDAGRSNGRETMSQVKSAPYEITHYKDGEPHAHSFTDRSEFIDKLNIIKQAGVEYDAEWPDDEPAPFEADANQCDNLNEGDEPDAAPGERRAMQCDEHGETTHELYHSGEWLCLDCEEDQETDETDDSEDDEEPEVMTNGGTKNGIDHPTQVVKEDDTEPVVADEVSDNPPERDITDDPIEWLNRSAGEFVDNIKGTDAINKKGFRVLQYWYDIDTDSEVVVGPEETEFQYCRVKAKATMPDGQQAVAHGSAHVDRGDDMPILLEMADTRAKSRALSDITGVGAVAVAELKDSES